MQVAGPTTLYLPEILANTRAVVSARKREADRKALERQAAEHTPRGFAQALRNAAASGPAIIAELKKASPSKGLIRAAFEPEALAVELEEAGAAVLSVLTDEKFFQGSLDYLRAVSGAVRLPLLRKDFMVDEFQMLEARANCADAVLLIVAALDDRELRHLRDAARRMELDVLCEVHDAEEADRAHDLGCECVGVNSRNLKTFEVSLERTAELVGRLPKEAVRVAESGIRTREEIDSLRAAGYHAFLIGETLMRQPSPGDALRTLLA